MKKFTTKLLMSIIAVAFAFVALGTSTYAWFAMNDTVTAQGMSITAKSDSTFLLIKAGHNTAAQVQTGKLIIDDAVNQTAELYPVAHETITNSTAADAESTDLMTNWYYKTSTDPALYGGDGKESAKQSIASADFDKYVLVNEFTLTIAEGGNTMSDLKVKNCTITTAGDAAVKVLVATETGAEEFSATGAGSEILQTALSSSTTMNVKIYIYWDGTDADVYTNGIADLKETSVVVTFTGTVD